MERTSSNPVFNKAFDSTYNTLGLQQGAMSFNGVVNKTATLLSLVLVFAGLTWASILGGLINPSFIFAGMMGGVVVQIVLTIFLIKNPAKAQSLSILYAIIEGVVIGAISLFYNTRYPGIVFNAIILTSGAVLAMLFLYRTQIIKVTENLKLMIGAATMAIGLAYLVAFVLSLFHIPVPMIHEGSPAGIIFSLVVLGVAVFNLVLDFDQIERGVEQKAPAHMEWYCSFGLMVTIMWVYLEMLRLLSKLNKK